MFDETLPQIRVEHTPDQITDRALIYPLKRGLYSLVFIFLRERMLQLAKHVLDHSKVMSYKYRLENWLLLVEAVTSHGPVNPKRLSELKKLFAKSKDGIVYVTAFPGKQTMARYVSDISWETEVWEAESPGHLIHFDGERFLGPY